MVHKKVDNRIRVMIENGVTLGHRSMFFVVGERGRHQVMFLHHMLTKASLRARPNILWCYKSDLGFTSHQKKQMKKFQKRYREGGNVNTGESPFELFVLSTNIRYCYYSETHNILGNTFGMCVLQDFEALTPNLLARTIETVDGGGIIVILLKSVSSLKQLYTMTMDVHARYRTEAHQDVVGRFNERFILSLASCKNCMVLDDSLNVLPLSSHTANIKAVQPKSWDDRLSPEEKQLMELKESLQDTQPIGVLVNCCKTVDQAKALLKFVETITDKTLRNTVSLTAARGRGKSAALGLAMAAAVAFSYSNMFVTSPSPENLTTFFEFVFKGFDALGYEEHIDYEIVQSTNKEFHKVVVRVNIFKEHRQTIQYFQPSDANKLSQAELVIIDEAAAIPLPLVKGLLGPYLVFMASTINGYEGTGRSLSLKLVQQLRQQSLTFGNSAADAKSLSDGKTSASGRVLSEIQLNESIRYKNGDIVEAWLNSLLCLDASVVQHLASGCPDPQDCDLYYINRDTLFSYHRASELFLQRLMALYVSSHYKNTPDDLQMMSDAPAHNLFCLLGPVSSSSENKLPEILCVVQVCLEGAISKDSSMRSLTRGKIAAGDLIPWTVAQQFQDTDFPCLSGARIIRIATHPNYQKMGYGTRALELLQQYYEGKITTFDEPKDVAEIEQVTEETIELLHEKIAPRKCLPPLLYKLSERRPEKLDYLGVSYGITHELLKFWKKSGYVPVYLRQTKNDLTGEHSCIMLKVLNSEEGGDYVAWLGGFWNDFRRRFISLLGFQFSEFSSSMALNILTHSVANCDGDVSELTKEELNVYFTNYDLKRLDLYSRNMIDYHLVTDLLPNLAKLYFMQKFNDVGLTHLPACILVGMGLQHKTVDDLSKEIDIAPSQLLAIFNRIIRKFTQYLSGVKEADIANKLFKTNNESVVEEEEPEQEPQPETTTNEDDLPDDDEREASAKKFEEIAELEGINLKQYAIKGSKEDWNKMLEAKGTVSTVCLKSKRKPSKDPLFKSTERFEEKKKEKKKKNKKLKTTFK